MLGQIAGVAERGEEYVEERIERHNHQRDEEQDRSGAEEPLRRALAHVDPPRSHRGSYHRL